MLRGFYESVKNLLSISKIMVNKALESSKSFCADDSKNWSKTTRNKRTQPSMDHITFYRSTFPSNKTWNKIYKVRIFLLFTLGIHSSFISYCPLLPSWLARRGVNGRGGSYILNRQNPLLLYIKRDESYLRLLRVPKGELFCSYFFFSFFHFCIFLFRIIFICICVLMETFIS